MIRMITLAVLLLMTLGCCSKQEANSPGAKIPKQTEKRETLLYTVANLLETSELVGETVRVKGRCLGYGSDLVIGTPPRTRSDWVLEDNGKAIYVTGPFPPGCSGLEPGKEPVVITGVVAVDTLTSLADGSKTPRYFLIATE
jgi:hypothetical protein